jgi:hypothetical protein
MDGTGSALALPVGLHQHWLGLVEGFPAEI